jgi:hypothetical protein
VDSFDAMLERDPDFARRVLELESSRLHKLVKSDVGANHAIRRNNHESKLI